MKGKPYTYTHTDTQYIVHIVKSNRELTRKSKSSLKYVLSRNRVLLKGSKKKLSVQSFLAKYVSV